MRVRKGVVAAPILPWSVSICDEGISLWLVVLRVADFEKVHVLASTWSTLVGASPETVDRWKSKVTTYPEARDMPSSDIGFASGSHGYLNSVLGSSPTRQWVYRLISNKRASGGEAAPGRYTKISHASVGGVTLVKGLFGLVGFPNIEIPPTVKRNIGHILDHEERPHTCSASPQGKHYTADDLVSHSELDLPVIYSTWGSSQGWGSRRLSAKEVRQMFDLPRWITHVEPIYATFTPLLLSAATSDAALLYLSSLSFESLSLESPESSASTVGEPSDPRKRQNTQPDAVWLPELQKSLPGAWATGSVTASKATKADDALVQMAPWRLRIQLIFPSPDWALERLERLMMKFYRRRLFRSLLGYLQRTHGDDWKSQFLPPCGWALRDRID